MLLGVIADDFTGASAIANTIAKGLSDTIHPKPPFARPFGCPQQTLHRNQRP